MVCAARSIGLTKCYRNPYNNYEPFSFRRTSQNVTTASNQAIGVNHLKTDEVNSNLTEDQSVCDGSAIQEEGNCSLQIKAKKVLKISPIKIHKRL